MFIIDLIGKKNNLICVETVMSLNLETIICRCFHKGNDATSIPSQCCAFPFTLSGHLYYNCTVNPAINNDFGCYNDNGQWVTCQRPEGTFTLGEVVTIKRLQTVQNSLPVHSYNLGSLICLQVLALPSVILVPRNKLSQFLSVF